MGERKKLIAGGRLLPVRYMQPILTLEGLKVQTTSMPHRSQALEILSASVLSPSLDADDHKQHVTITIAHPRVEAATPEKKVRKLSEGRSLPRTYRQENLKPKAFAQLRSKPELPAIIYAPVKPSPVFARQRNFKVRQFDFGGVRIYSPARVPVLFVN